MDGGNSTVYPAGSVGWRQGVADRTSTDWFRTCFCARWSLDHFMETVPISNLATAGLPPQVLSKASGVSSATGASGPKVCAQVVGEVLNRHASSSIAQPVAPSRVTTAPKTAARAESAPRSAKDEPHRAESSNRTNPPNLNLLLNLVMPLQLPALDSLRLPDLALSGNPTVSGAIAAGAAATGPAMGGNGAGSTAPTPGREPKTAGLPAQ